MLEDKMASVSKTTFTSVAKLGELKTACDLRKESADYNEEIFPQGWKNWKSNLRTWLFPMQCMHLS